MTEAPQDLLDDIRAALERDPQINLHDWPLKVWSQNGRVVLDGQVADITAKRKAVSHAQERLSGSYPLLDLVRVATETRGEKEIANRIAWALAEEPVFADYALYEETQGQTEIRQQPDAQRGRIKVSVDEDRVTLSGQVSSLTHWRMAEVLAWWTEGCGLLENQLEVIPPQEDRDEEITDAVRMVLEKDPLVNAEQIQVSTSNAVVHLKGLAGNDEEKRLMVRDAWYIPGLREVRDEILTPQREAER